MNTTEIPAKLLADAKAYNGYSEAYAISCLWASHSYFYSIKDIEAAVIKARQ